MSTIPAAQRLPVLARQINRLASKVNAILDRCEEPQGPWERAICLQTLSVAREEAEALGRELPSPNQAPPELQEDTARLGKSIFAFIEACRIREEEGNALMASIEEMDTEQHNGLN